MISHYLPSQQQIQAECRAIRAGWTRDEEIKRRRGCRVDSRKYPRVVVHRVLKRR